MSPARAKNQCAPPACPLSPAHAPAAWAQRYHGPDVTPQDALRCWERHQTPPPPHAPSRSEEHTSELQSLMRISYAVFCLKKKKSSQLTTTLNTDTLEVQSNLLSLMNITLMYSINHLQVQHN